MRYDVSLSLSYLFVYFFGKKNGNRKSVTEESKQKNWDKQRNGFGHWDYGAFCVLAEKTSIAMLLMAMGIKLIISRRRRAQNTQPTEPTDQSPSFSPDIHFHVASTDFLTRLLYSLRFSWYSLAASAFAGDFGFGSHRSDCMDVSRAETS